MSVYSNTKKYDADMYVVKEGNNSHKIVVQ